MLSTDFNLEYLDVKVIRAFSQPQNLITLFKRKNWRCLARCCHTLSGANLSMNLTIKHVYMDYQSVSTKAWIAAHLMWSIRYNALGAKHSQYAIHHMDLFSIHCKRKTLLFVTVNLLIIH